MYIKNEIELFTKLGVIAQYNALINQLTSLEFNLNQLASVEHYSADLFEFFSREEVDEYNQEYLYGCLGELKAAFKQKTGDNLDLVIDDCGYNYWKVVDFFITVRNPAIRNIERSDLT